MAERFGRAGERWGGYCIALIGLGSVVGSFGRGVGACVAGYAAGWFFQDPPEWLGETFRSCQLSAHTIMLLAEAALALTVITGFGIHLAFRKEA